MPGYEGKCGKRYRAGMREFRPPIWVLTFQNLTRRGVVVEAKKGPYWTTNHGTRYTLQNAPRVVKIWELEK